MKDLRELQELVATAVARVPRDPARPWILAAVSGGADSSALAMACAAANGPDDRIAVAHVDHGVRSCSGLDADAVRQLAARLGVRFECERLRLSSSVSEARLRDARYAALSAIARRLGARAIMTGHHAQDQVETALFRAARGTGIRGLAGIPQTRLLPCGTWLVRPFLDIERAELSQVCAVAQLQPREDPSNRDTARTRNHIRHELLPELRARHGPDLDALVLASTRAARDIAETRERAGRRALERFARRLPGAAGWDLDTPDALDRTALSEALRSMHCALVEDAPSRAWLRRAGALVDGPPGRRLAGRGSVIEVTRTRTGLRIHSG